MMKMSLHFFLQKHNRLTLAVVGLLGISLIGGYFIYGYVGFGVMNYVNMRDRAGVTKMFKDDWNILIAQEHHDTYSLDEFLDEAKSHGEQLENAQFKVLRKNGKTVAFACYYQKSPFWWHLLFLMVDKDHRRQGYAKKMLNAAIDDMRSRGAIKITISTRQDNKTAQALYHSAGFTDLDFFGIYMDLIKYFPKK